MKTCKGCKWAQWQLTSNGRLHPSGDGKCVFPVKIPVLPQAFHWASSGPAYRGGFICRSDELPAHCVYYAREGSSGNVIVRLEPA